LPLGAVLRKDCVFHVSVIPSAFFSEPFSLLAPFRDPSTYMHRFSPPLIGDVFFLSQTSLSTSSNATLRLPNPPTLKVVALFFLLFAPRPLCFFSQRLRRNPLHGVPEKPRLDGSPFSFFRHSLPPSSYLRGSMPTVNLPESASLNHQISPEELTLRSPSLSTTYPDSPPPFCLTHLPEKYRSPFVGSPP